MKSLVTFFCLILAGCSSIDFNSSSEGLVYYEPKPYLFLTVTDKCISIVTVVSIPGRKKYMSFSSGYGSSHLSAEFSNGIVTKVGHTSDSKIPETLASIAALGTAQLLADGQQPNCEASATMFPIVNGEPDTNAPINFTIGQ